MTDLSGQFAYPWYVLIIVCAIGDIIANVPSKEEHYNRNKNQEDIIPDDPLSIIKSPDWEEQPDGLNRYHRHTCGEQGEAAKQNKKYMTKDGRYEVIINFSNPDNPTIVTDPYNIGTYNYGTTPIAHFFRDMLPYYFWGNSEIDSGFAFAWNRIWGAQ